MNGMHDPHAPWTDARTSDRSTSSARAPVQSFMNVCACAISDSVNAWSNSSTAATSTLAAALASMAMPVGAVENADLPTAVAEGSGTPSLNACTIVAPQLDVGDVNTQPSVAQDCVVPSKPVLAGALTAKLGTCDWSSHENVRPPATSRRRK